MEDDTLDWLLAAADPARTPVDAPLTLRQREVRDRILNGRHPASAEPEQRPMSRMRPAAAALLAAASIAVLLVLLPWVVRPQAAVALTPRPLQFVSSGQMPEELMDMVTREGILARSGPSVPLRESRTVGWYAQLTENEDATTAAVIAPEVTTFSWRPDLSGRLTVTAGQPYWADASGVPISDAEASPPGTVISRMSFNPGEFEPSVLDTPGNTMEAVVRFLRSAGFPEDGDAADMIDAITNGFSSWTLTTPQQALILKLLLDRTDVEVLGTATDRAGRDVTGIAADSHRFPGTRKILLVSHKTGRISGVETIATTASAGVPAGAVVAYSLWDVDQ